jgi:hypothetical protein
MKGLKFALVVLGLLGIVGLFLPYVSMGEMSYKMWDARHEEALKVYLPLAGYGVAALMGLIAVRSGLGRIHSLLALLGFGLAMLVKEVRIGLTGEGALQPAIGGKVVFIAAALGLLVSLIGLIKPEKA